MSEDVEIRLAEAGDVEAILRVELECGEAPQWGEMVWRRLIAENEVGLRCVLVAEGVSGVVGFVVTGGVANIAEMESVAVEVAARGQGIGNALCRQATYWAAEHGAIAIELEARASNTAALKMYAGLGFLEQGVRRAYYQGPVEDAVLMTAVLKGR